MSFREILERCNHTELYQMCVDQGIPVSAALTQEQLIECYLGEMDVPPNERHDVDTWRIGIMGFLLDHWEVVKAQLECPAKSGDPKACFGCTDAMVLSCVLDNEPNEELIQLKRRREPWIQRR